jgi:hypothetical protein
MSTREIGRWQRTVSWNETYGTDNDDFTATTTHTTTRSVTFTTSIVYDNSGSMSTLMNVNASWVPQRQTVDGPRFLKEHDVVGAKWYPKITNMLMDIFGNENCKKAFSDAGIDLNAVWKNGFYIGSSTLITDNSISDTQTSLPKDVREGYRQHLKTNSSFFSKVVASTVFVKGDPRPRIFLTHNAVAAGFFTRAEDTLKSVLIHELIHVGLKPGIDPGMWRYLGYDDLSYMQKEYENIMRNCR